jgi:hypothetical protein
MCCAEQELDSYYCIMHLSMTVAVNPLLGLQDVSCSAHWGRASSNKKRNIVKKAGLERANLKYLIKVHYHRHCRVHVKGHRN